MSDENLIVGRVHLNGRNAPFIKILVDTCSCQSDGSIVLLRRLGEGRGV